LAAGSLPPWRLSKRHRGGQHDDRLRREERVLTERTDNVFSDISEEEQRARDAAVSRANYGSRGLDAVIATRVRHLQDEKPAPDLRVAREAIKRAETRREWAAWHRQQAERHRAALTHLVDHHESAAERLEGAAM